MIGNYAMPRHVCDFTKIDVDPILLKRVPLLRRGLELYEAILPRFLPFLFHGFVTAGQRKAQRPE